MTNNAGQGEKRIAFGTDGWRAVIADDFTFVNLRKVAQATADYLKSDFSKPEGENVRVCVGYDTRFLSAKFAQIVAEVLAANDISAVLSDRAVPTPALSFAVKKRSLDLGVMITASHNPPEFNGYKIKNAQGGAADVGVTRKVESLIGQTESKAKSFHDGVKDGSINVADISKDYVAFLRSYIDLKAFKKAKFRVLLDAMYGSGNSYIADVLKGTSIRLELMRNEVNPWFEGRGPEPVEDNVQKIIRRMKEGKHDIGLILDGDADRIAAVDSEGEYIPPQKILGLLALHLRQDKKWDGGIVTTIAGTTMLEHIAADLGLELHETPVGFKYISNLMETKNILVGGEEAGGMGLKNYIPERDGTLAGLMLVEMMLHRKKKIRRILEEMEKKYGRYYYLRSDMKLRSKNYHLDAKQLRADSLLGKKVVKVKDYDGTKLICEDESWLMFRASGTEPKMRVYSEAKSLKRAKDLIALGNKMVNAVIRYDV
ncbi:MAG: phosphoglucomutase/phosphomannomutase family protein [Candidatus Omnitrophica bacterium]|nr:phosphoglucomutase/phosphomannomutase family protein [Candidatus Omnitrophota bacterium]